MITVPAGIRVLVATKPVDFRKGGDGLAALVREALGEDPFSGTIFPNEPTAPGAVLETAGARGISVAARSAMASCDCLRRRLGLVAAPCARCCTAGRNVMSAATF